MGFSVSGSAVIIFVGVFIGLGMFITAATNTFEQVSDAQEAKTEAALTAENTAIEIKAAEYTNNRLTVLVNNTGATPLAIDRTDFLVDGEYVEDWERDARVNGASGASLWLPGEQLNITIRTNDTPSRVKVVTEGGIADTEAEVL